MIRTRDVHFCCILLLATAAAAAAQTAPPTWTFEVHGGGAFGSGPSGGSRATFPAGETFATETATQRPSRMNPSWFFGDGAALFNEVQAQFASQLGHTFARIAPLDAVLTSAALERGTAPVFGARLTRRLSNRVGLELAVSRHAGPWRFTGAVDEALEAARASFEQGFTGLLDLQSGLAVTSTLTRSDGDFSETAATAAVVLVLAESPRFSTRLIAGGGRAFTGGGTPGARLEGNYRYRFLDTFPINETDTVTIRFEDRAGSNLAVVGGGLTIHLGDRSGLRLDVRAHLRQAGMVTIVEARPTIAAGTPSIALPSNTTPSIQFSTVTGVRSSLGGSTTLTTFTGEGLDTRVLVTAGYVVRF